MFLGINHRPILISQEIETSSVDWVQLSRIYVKTETESSQDKNRPVYF
jgi:hypothetical protein